MTSTTRILAGLGVGLALILAGCGDRDSSPAATARAAEGPAEELPDRHIAFRRYLGDAHTQGAIFVMRSAGSGERQLTDPEGGATDDYPDWSPDGRLIAFQRSRFAPRHQCAVLRLDGRTRTAARRSQVRVPM